jgi:hypothetical protein
MKNLFLLGLLAHTALVTTVAFADGKAACLDAASKGQRFRDNHKLVEAREQFRVCAAAGCPGVVQSDCASWLAEVDRALPSIVVTAKNGAGADLVNVKVSMDGQPLMPKLEGQAVSMNAGLHTFHFEGEDGTSLDQQVMVKEGEKSQGVAVVLGAAPSLPSAARSESSQVSESAPESGGASRPGKTLGWVLGSLGVAGLGLGAVAGVLAMQDKNDNCVGNVCSTGTVSGIRSRALLSDIGWVSGGVLLAGGAALIVFTPSRIRESTTRLRVAPLVMANGGGLLVGGRW